MKKIILSLVLLISTCLLFFAQAATNMPIENGSFETGDYTGWTLIETPDTVDTVEYGTWGIAEHDQIINHDEATFDFFNGIDVKQTSFGLPHTYTATDGVYVAYQLQNNSQLHLMYQDIDVCEQATELTWYMEYETFAEFDPVLQYSAVEIHDPDSGDILSILFKTTTGDPDSIPMTNMSADISEFAGQTIRLIVIHQTQLIFFDAAWDDFRIPGCETGEPDKLDTVGFEAPADKSFISIKKKRTLPLKAFIYKDGVLVTNTDLVAPPIVRVMPAPDNVTSSGLGTDDSQFVFTGEGKWQFNLKIKNYKSGTYIVTMESGDETEYLLDPVPTVTILVK